MAVADTWSKNPVQGDKYLGLTNGRKDYVWTDAQGNITGNANDFSGVQEPVQYAYGSGLSAPDPRVYYNYIASGTSASDPRVKGAAYDVAKNEAQNAAQIESNKTNDRAMAIINSKTMSEADKAAALKLVQSQSGMTPERFAQTLTRTEAPTGPQKATFDVSQSDMYDITAQTKAGAEAIKNTVLTQEKIAELQKSGDIRYIGRGVVEGGNKSYIDSYGQIRSQLGLTPEGASSIQMVRAQEFLQMGGPKIGGAERNYRYDVDITQAQKDFLYKSAKDYAENVAGNVGGIGAKRKLTDAEFEQTTQYKEYLTALDLASQGRIYDPKVVNLLRSYNYEGTPEQFFKATKIEDGSIAATRTNIKTGETTIAGGPSAGVITTEQEPDWMRSLAPSDKILIKTELPFENGKFAGEEKEITVAEYRQTIADINSYNANLQNQPKVDIPLYSLGTSIKGGGLPQISTVSQEVYTGLTGEIPERLQNKKDVEQYRPSIKEGGLPILVPTGITVSTGPTLEGVKYALEGAELVGRLRETDKTFNYIFPQQKGGDTLLAPSAALYDKPNMYTPLGEIVGGAIGGGVGAAVYFMNKDGQLSIENVMQAGQKGKEIGASIVASKFVNVNKEGITTVPEYIEHKVEQGYLELKGRQTSNDNIIGKGINWGQDVAYGLALNPSQNPISVGGVFVGKNLYAQYFGQMNTDLTQYERKQRFEAYKQTAPTIATNVATIALIEFGGPVAGRAIGLAVKPFLGAEVAAITRAGVTTGVSTSAKGALVGMAGLQSSIQYTPEGAQYFDVEKGLIGAGAALAFPSIIKGETPIRAGSFKFESEPTLNTLSPIKRAIVEFVNKKGGYIGGQTAAEMQARVGSSIRSGADVDAYFAKKGKITPDINALSKEALEVAKSAYKEAGQNPENLILKEAKSHVKVYDKVLDKDIVDLGLRGTKDKIVDVGGIKVRSIEQIAADKRAYVKAQTKQMNAETDTAKFAKYKADIASMEAEMNMPIKPQVRGWSGLYLQATPESKASLLLGLSEKGKLTLGNQLNLPELIPSWKKAYFPEPLRSNKETYPKSGLYTRFMADPEMMRFAGASEADILQVQRTIEIARALKNKSSTFTTDFPSETKVMNAKETQIVRNWIARGQREGWFGRVYGSFSSEAQTETLIRRIPGDIEGHITEGAYKNEMTKLINDLKGVSKDKFTIGSDKNPYALVKNGEQALDLKVEGMSEGLVSTEGKGYRYGMKEDRPSIVVKEFEVQPLGEQIVRKGATSVGFYRGESGELVARPPSHRMKDVSDFYAYSRTLAKSSGDTKLLSTIEAYREQALKIMPEVAKELEQRNLKFEIDAGAAKKGVNIDPNNIATGSATGKTKTNKEKTYSPSLLKTTKPLSASPFSSPSRSKSSATSIPTSIFAYPSASVSLKSPALSPYKSPSPSPYRSVSVSPSQYRSPSPSVSVSPSVSPSPSPYRSPSPSPYRSPSPSPYRSPSPSPYRSPSPSPYRSPSPSPSPSPYPKITPKPRTPPSAPPKYNLTLESPNIGRVGTKQNKQRSYKYTADLFSAYQGIKSTKRNIAGARTGLGIRPLLIEEPKTKFGGKQKKGLFD